MIIYKAIIIYIQAEKSLISERNANFVAANSRVARFAHKIMPEHKKSVLHKQNRKECVKTNRKTKGCKFRHESSHSSAKNPEKIRQKSV